MSRKLRAKTGQKITVQVVHPREGVVRPLEATVGFGFYCKRTGRLIGAGATEHRAQLRAGKTGWYTAESLTPKGID